MTDRPSIPTAPPAWLEHLLKRFDDMIDSMAALSRNVGLLVGQYRSVSKDMGDFDGRLKAVEEARADHEERISKLERKASGE